MRKFLKVVFFSFIVVLIALGGTFIYLRRHFTPEKIRELAINYAEKSINRKVKLENASLTLKGFSLYGLKISEYPDFEKGEFLTAGKFVLSPAFLPLLKGKVQINSLYVEGLRIRIVEKEKNIYNFSDLLAKQEKGKGETSAPGKSLELCASAFSVTDSQIYFRNIRGLEFIFSNIEFSAGDISGRKKFPFELKSVMQVKMPAFLVDMPLEAEGNLSLPSFDPEKGAAEIKKGEISLGNIKAVLSGNLSNLFEPDCELNAKVGAFSGADLKKFVPKIPSKIAFPEIGAETRFKFAREYFKVKKAEVKAGPLSASLDGNLRFEPAFRYHFNLSATADMPELDISKAARAFKKLPEGIVLPPSKISLKMKIAPERLSLKKISFRLKRSAVSLKGSVLAGKDVSAKLYLNLKKLDIGEIAGIYAKSKKFHPRGLASGSLSVNYSKKLPSVAGSLRFEKIAAKGDGFSVADLSGKAVVKRDSFFLKKIRGKLNGSPLSADLQMLRFSRNPNILFNIHLNKITLPKMKPSAAVPSKKTAKQKRKFPPLSIRGKVKIDEVENSNFTGKAFYASVNLHKITPELSKISGSSSFSIKNGRVEDVYQIIRDYKPAKIVLYPVVILQKASKKVKTLPNFNVINYSVISGEYTFSRGNMTIKKSDLYSDMADVATRGNVYLPSEKLNVEISVKLHKKSGISMSVPACMKITGTFASPKVKLDVKSVLKQPKIKKAIDKGAKKLFKKLFK